MTKIKKEFFIIIFLGIMCLVCCDISRRSVVVWASDSISVEEAVVNIDYCKYLFCRGYITAEEFRTYAEPYRLVNDEIVALAYEDAGDLIFHSEDKKPTTKYKYSPVEGDDVLSLYELAVARITRVKPTTMHYEIGTDFADWERTNIERVGTKDVINSLKSNADALGNASGDAINKGVDWAISKIVKLVWGIIKTFAWIIVLALSVSVINTIIRNRR